MGAGSDGQDDIQGRVTDLQHALVALRSVGIDAVVLPDGDRTGVAEVHTLSGTDRPYRSIVESMGEGAVTVTGSGMVVFANRQVAALLGIEPSWMVGRDAATFVSSAHAPVLAELLETAPGEVRRAELALVTSSGEEVPVQVAATALDLADAKIRCLVVTDLTLQKEMERELAIQSVRAEQRAERQRVAHEVNDTIVQGLVTAEMALDLGDVDRAREIVALVSDQARRWIGNLAGGEQIAPGTAVRSGPAQSHGRRS